MLKSLVFKIEIIIGTYMEQVNLFLVDDLHLEGRPVEMQQAFAKQLHEQITSCKSTGNIPVLICAGDIAEKDAGIDWASQFKCDVIYICGNHEFWNNDYYEVIDTIREKCKKPGYEHIHFLHNEEVILHGVRFLGATLWTELAQSWSWIKRNYVLKHFLSMADFRRITARKFYKNSSKVDEMFKFLIKNGVEHDQATNLIATESFNPFLQIQENAASVDFLENKIIEPFEGKTVVVSHHLPIPDFWMKTLNMNENILTAPYINNKAVYQEYLKQKIPAEKDILMMGFYVNNFYHFFEHNFAPDIWIHGHFHKEIDSFIGTTRMASNPVGYMRQSETMNIKKIVIGDEVKNYIDFAINSIENFNWNDKVNANLSAFKSVIKNFANPISEEELKANVFEPVLGVFKKQHDKNLKDIEMFVSGILYNLIKIINKEQTLSDQLYITSYISGFAKFASKYNTKFGIDSFIFNLNENSFLTDAKYKKVTNKLNFGHFVEWIKEIEKIEGQSAVFKKTLIDFFNHLKTETSLEKIYAEEISIGFSEDEQ